MKKFYLSFFVLFSFNMLSAQVKPVEVYAAPAEGKGIQFFDKQTSLPVNDLVWQEAEAFAGGFAKVYSTQGWGFVGTKGNIVIEAKYQSVRNFCNRIAAVQVNSKWGFIDEKGRIIVPHVYDIVFDFKETRTAVYKDQKWSLIDRQGKLIKALNIDAFYGFKNGTARFTRKGKAGLMNTNGDILSMESAGESQKEVKSISKPGSVAVEPCPDNIGFERGNFTNWNCFTGDVNALGTTNVITVSPSAPTPNRHVIYPATNPSALDPYGLFPINPPDGSGYALKLGNNINGAEAERVRFQFVVSANAEEASITYRYAVVFQDPGHLKHQQPRFSARLLDVATNKYLPCASYEYVAEDSIPGFFNSPIDDSVKCKNWASVYINLSAYAGKTLILEFTTADCTLGAHWGYAYVDVGDCNISAQLEFECNPNLVKLSAPPGFRSYRWWDENYTSIIGFGQNITLNPAPPGTSLMHVDLLPYNGAACRDTLHVTSINTSPIADAGPDKTVCLGTRVAIGTSSIPDHTYSWTPSTFLSNPNVAAPVSNATVTTTYILAVTKTSNGCIDYDTVTVNVNAKPAAAFGAPEGQCIAANEFTFGNSSTGAISYQWFFGDGDSSNLIEPTHSYSAAQDYIVKMIATGSNGCTDSADQLVSIFPTPQVSTIEDVSICRGNSIQLKATGAHTYEWSPATGLSCIDCASPLASPTNTTTYIVTGTSIHGCVNFDTVVVTVFQPIEIVVSPGSEICEKESVQLSVSGASNYKWTPSTSLDNDSGLNPIATPKTTTQYRVIGFDGHSCFTDTGYVTVTVNPNPTVKLGPDINLSTGSILPLNPVTTNGPIVLWQWNPVTDLTCGDCPEPVATIKNDITYEAIVRNIYGCEAADTIVIKTFCEGSQVFIPNAFTPDGDGINDILMVRAKGISQVKSFRIYSRWGELLFEKTNFPPNTAAYGWDGTIRGKTGAPEVYVYTAEVTCDNLQTYTYKGNTAILK